MNVAAGAALGARPYYGTPPPATAPSGLSSVPTFVWVVLAGGAVWIFFFSGGILGGASSGAGKILDATGGAAATAITGVTTFFSNAFSGKTAYGQKSALPFPLSILG